MEALKQVMKKLFKTKNFREYPEFDDHEMLISVSDEQSGLSGFIGVHSTTLGPALGGTRLQSYSSESDAMRDALNLSRAMSYKCALAGLPYGGGKGVVVFNKNNALNKEELLAAYARMVENLRGLFKTGTDVGVSDDDVRHMAKYTSHMLGVAEAERGNLSTSSCAALGVFYSIQAALEVLFGSSDMNGRTVAIKGVGKLGAELARLIHKAGGTVVVADVSKTNLNKLIKEIPGISVVSTSNISHQKVDIYSPCALGAEFNETSVKKLRCKAVVGGANNQLESSGAGQAIHNRGILYVPDYVANAGGLIYVADELEPGGFSQERVLERTQDIQRTVTDILTRSQIQGLPTSAVADTIAKERVGILRS